MKSLLLLFSLLLCTCVRAQNTFTSQSENEDDTKYYYSLRTNKIDREELVMAFAKAAEVTVNARFSGDWTTSDDEGIEYHLNTRRHRLHIDYQGDDPAVKERAKAKVQDLKRRLGLDAEK